MKINLLPVGMGAVLIICLLVACKDHLIDFAGNFSGGSVPDAKDFVIVVDAGHGGMDPGKVGVNNELEKEINLAIAYELAERIQESGMTAVMTRTSDDGLYSQEASNKKMDDLNKRISIIEESKCVLAVSIHQNSYSDGSVKGAQVFYFKNSQEGKKIAGFIQECLEKDFEDGSNRPIKENDNYYMLKKSQAPTIIVECGFLSNSEEAEKLSDSDYQKRMADSICDGIIMYLNDMIDSDGGKA